MKRKIFIQIIFAAIALALLKNFGFMESGVVEFRGRLIRNSCDPNDVLMRAISISDSSLTSILNGSVSLENPFRQNKIERYISEWKNNSDTVDFLIVGNLIQDRKLHCSGSACFRVKRIKEWGRSQFTEF